MANSAPMSEAGCVMDLEALLPQIRGLTRRAGAAIMKVYATDFDVERKEDDSPVTAADLAAEAIITHGLSALPLHLPIVAEEAASAGYLPAVADGPFWLVDPLDGTKEFLNRNGEFTVNIALIYDRRPVLGVVAAPALDVTFSGAAGMGAERTLGGAAPQPIRVRIPPAQGLAIVASRRHGNPEALQRYLGGRRVAERKSIGSSLKFCLVAAGEADLYPRFGPTMEWDTAAGHAVLAAAGGRVTTVDGEEFLYAKSGFANPPFIAHGGG